MGLKSVIMGLGFVILWSSAFTSAKIIVQYSPPLLILAVRFFLTGGFGLILANIFYEKISLTNKEWYSLIAFGLCQNTIYLGCNFIAMGSIDAFLAVIIASMLPILVAIFSWVTKTEKIGFMGTVGMLFGIFGCLIILKDKVMIPSNLFGIVFCLIGATALAVATLLVKNTISNKNQILRVVSIQMLVGGLPLIFLSIIFETWKITFSTSFIIAFFYTCFFPGLLATIVWFNLVRKEGAIRASAFHFLNPPMGVLIASLILAETIEPLEIFGIIILMIAIYLIYKSRYHQT